jgi:3-hydroxyisobutyrate dehydrogenase
MAKPRLGYVGTGLMGGPMLRRLLGLGYPIAAFDIVPDKVPEAAERMASPAGVCTGAAFVLLNLPRPDTVEAAVFGRDGIAGALEPDQLVIDFSTIEVDTARDLAGRLRAATGAGWIDAPVSGGPPAAAAGTLTVMAGGDPAEIARITPLMADIAGRFTHLGPVGSGLAAKMINQLIVGCGYAVLAEALTLARTAGIDPARLPDCLAGGHADSALLQRLFPRLVARDFAPQGYARQLLKDLEMVNGLAGDLHAPVPMLGQALSLYRMLAHRGHAELDAIAVLKLYERD